ncbi:hypothetical protein [Kriegella aquimaris]|uniref:Lipoprotein n=1 Tax=Kriegella aquimaris TaxID=192904 RepID=A0A1G9RDA9_9FLAO|nr:hypothetical protein [Kriegella aquimaris]SDM21203.1 hypothetical protein SAMN04488514_10690 [Kriegella aquimaris]
MMKLYYIFFSSLLISCYSCATFDSVKSMGKITQNLNRLKETYVNKPCDIDFVFNDAKSDYCQKFRLNDSVRMKTIDLLVTYGKTLEEFAEKSDFSADEQIDLLMNNSNSANWTHLSHYSVEGTQRIVNSIFSLINNTVRQKTLRNEILKNNDSFQNIIGSLEGDLELRKEFYVKINNTIEDYMNENDDFDADRREIIDNNDNQIGFAKRNRLDKINIRFLQNKIKNEIDLINNSLKFLTASGDAHSILATNYQSIGTKNDIKVMQLILKDLKGIYKGFDKLMSE